MNNTAYASDGQENPRLRSALDAAERGWFVLPLYHPIGQRCSCGKDCGKDIGKHPRIKDWPTTATRDPDLITRWWTQWPEANIGILTGAKSGLVVIDIDPRNGGHLTVDDLETEHGKFPATVESITGSPGRHLCYCHPGGTLRCGTDVLGPGVDVKADGGYIVVPPSLHASGRRYEWEVSSHPDDIPLAPLPEWIPLEDDTEEDLETGKRRSMEDYTGDRPGDDYNCRVTREEVRLLITEHGWTVIEHRDGVDYLRRPGKTSGMYSASLGYLKGNRLKVFTTSDPTLQPKKGGYQPFALYALLKHAGDFKAAAKALVEMGYGRNGQPSGDTHKAQDQAYHTGPNGDIGDDQQEAEQEIHDDPKYKPIAPYLIKWSPAKGTALYYQKPGTTDEQQLANFMAWIIEERLEDDGAESIRMVTMDATLTSGKQFPEIRIAVPEFYSLAGLMKALGTEAVVSPGPLVKDRIRHAIQLYSNRQKYPQRHVFTHLGWRQVDGVWCYLHAGGSIPAKAEVSVDKALQRYMLPETGSPQAAIKASLHVLECAPKRLTMPLLSMVYLAPLAHWLDPDVTGWLEGPSGAQKSSLVALIMCHYGHFSRVHPPDTWESTANTLERLAFLAKDILLWIDDYAPQPSAKEMHEQERKAQRVIRAQGNLSGRGRMRADTSLRPQYYPRGVILSTGELHPTGTSTFARLLQLDVAKGDINLDALTTSQADSHLLAEAMAVYVGWLQSQLDTLPSILKARWNELRTNALPHLIHHSRHPEVYAHLATAWELFLNCACSLGAIDEAERQVYWNVGCETLMQSINRQRLDAEAEDPVHRFCSHVKEALIQGKAYLDDVHGGYPDDAGQWGWTMQSFHHNDGTVSDEWKPSQGASMLGWVDKDFVYLLPDAAYRLVFENLQRAGVPLLPQQTLWKRLIDRGYVQRGENRYTTRKRIGSDRPHVLKVVRRYVEDHLSPQSGDSGDIGDNEL